MLRQPKFRLPRTGSSHADVGPHALHALPSGVLHGSIPLISAMPGTMPLMFLPSLSCSALASPLQSMGAPRATTSEPSGHHMVERSAHRLQHWAYAVISLCSPADSAVGGIGHSRPLGRHRVVFLAHNEICLAQTESHPAQWLAGFRTSRPSS